MTMARTPAHVHYLFKVDDHFMSHIFLGLEHRNESMFAVSFLLQTLMVEVAVDCISVRCVFSFHLECCPGAYGESNDYITTAPCSRQVSSDHGVRTCVLVSAREASRPPKDRERWKILEACSWKACQSLAVECDESVYLN